MTDRSSKIEDVVRRSCFICGSLEGERLFEAEWPVVGCGLTTLGIRICSGCGMVLQDPTVPQELLSRYYRLFSNYTNPSRGGKPNQPKIDAVDRQLRVLSLTSAEKGSALQVGCSDGYTLHRLTLEGWTVEGVDPSPVAARLASDLWGVKVYVDFFERWASTLPKKYDLVVLTHVLEHMSDPLESLRLAHQRLNETGRLLIEVPVLVEPDFWPPGYFTLEHLNYFTERTLSCSLWKAGLIVAGNVRVQVDHVDYPVMTCVARPRKAGDATEPKMEPDGAIQACRLYLAREEREWKRIDSKLRRVLQSKSHVVIWGAGIHSAQLLSRTNLEEYAEIDFFVDSDSQKTGLTLANYPVKDPAAINFGDRELRIVISSHSSEVEIMEFLKSRPDLKAGVICLYH